MVSAPSILALGLVLLAQQSSATKTACPGFGNDTTELPTPSPTPCATIMILLTPSPTPCATTTDSYSNSSSPSPTPAATNVDSDSNSTAPCPTPAATNANTYPNATAPCPTPSTTTMAPSTPCPTAQDSSDSGAATVVPSDSSESDVGSSFNASAPSPSSRSAVSSSSSSSSSCEPYTVTLYTNGDFTGDSSDRSTVVQYCYNKRCSLLDEDLGSLEWSNNNLLDCYPNASISLYAEDDCEGDATGTWSMNGDFPSELSGVASYLVWESTAVPSVLTADCK